MEKKKTVDEYISEAPKEIQQKLKDLRAAILDVAPTARESTSYGLAYYFYKSRRVYFGYWKKHIGIYAIMEPVRKHFKKELEGYEMAKGTIQFPLKEKLPIGLIKKLVKAQMKQ